jgi:hypothetical protein
MHVEANQGVSSFYIAWRMQSEHHSIAALQRVTMLEHNEWIPAAEKGKEGRREKIQRKH